MTNPNDLIRDDTGRLRIMPSVYSVAFTETNTTFDEVTIPGPLWNVTARRTDFDEWLTEQGWGPLPADGEKKLGLLDLVHEPMLDAIFNTIAQTAPGITNPALAHRYPLHGSSAGIGMLLTHLRASKGIDQIRVLRGDYEGYLAQATNKGIEAIVTDPDDTQEGDYWFVSNPSARDGEPLDAGWLAELCETNHVAVDLAYHGLHGPSPTPVPDNAWAVLWSLSKPWGLFWRRCGAMAVREPIHDAYGTRWFKDPGRLAAAAVTVATHSPSEMSSKYRALQTEACELLTSAGVVTQPTSTFLLGLIDQTQVSPDIWTEVAHCQRVAGSGIARVCLSPILETLTHR